MLGRPKQTILRPGPWSFPAPRVLIEHADEDVALRYSQILRQAGYTVGVCHGPSGEPDSSERCVLTIGEPCAFVEGADVVVSALGVEKEQKRSVLEALRRFHPSKPLVVEVSADEVERFEDLIDGVHLVVSPVSAEELVAAVEDARDAPLS